MRSRWLAGVAAVLMATAAAVSFGTPATAAPSTVREAEWFLDALKIPDAQKISTGAGVVVAVIDTAIDSRVPDLSGQLLPGHSYISSSSDGAGTGLPTIHGTAMAGLIAGKGGGDQHMLGIAPGAKILPIAVDEGDKFKSAGGSARDIAAGIRWAADHGAKVINLSLGAQSAPPVDEADAVNYALSKDVVVVAAAGNAEQTGPNVSTPGNVPGVITVSGGTQSGDAWSGSAHGPEVVVAAPATSIPSTAPKEYSSNGFSISDGTSEGTAITSGVIALIRSKFPQLNAANVINRLIATAKDNGTPGRDPYFGFGSIRPVQALTANVPTVSTNPLLTAGASPTASSGQDSATGPTGIHRIPIAVIFGVAVLVVVLVVALVLVLVLVSGRRRRTPPGPPVMTAPTGQPHPGYPPPAQPGYPPGQPYPQYPPQNPTPGPGAPPPPGWR
jgi:type VII secretion-associated serine protease mycosin